MKQSVGGRLLVVTAISCLAGCSSIVESDRTTAEAARLLVTGSHASPLLVVTSTRFSTGLTPDGEQVVSLTLADSAWLSLPIDHEVRFRNSDRVYVSVRNPDATSTATIQMRVLVDGREVFSQHATLQEAALSFTYFLF